MVKYCCASSFACASLSGTYALHVYNCSLVLMSTLAVGARKVNSKASAVNAAQTSACNACSGGYVMMFELR